MAAEMQPPTNTPKALLVVAKVMVASLKYDNLSA